MKFLFTLFFILPLFVKSDFPYEKIKQAFELNDSKKIALMCKEKVLINIMGKENVYSQSQANLVLKDFFKRKPGSSFKFFFKGQQSLRKTKHPSDGSFAVGNYKSENSKFRVTIHLKEIDDEFKIESLIIELS